MVTISLLPPEKKENLRWVIKARRLTFFFVGSFFMAVVFAALLYSVANLLIIHYDSVSKAAEDEKASLSSRKVAGLENKIKNLNKDLMLISKLSEKQKNSIVILEILGNIMPQGVRLSRLSFSPETNRVIISGFSPTRSKYVLFEEGLRNYKKSEEEEPFFKNIEVPIKNYTNPANIDFNFTIDVNL